MVTSLVSLIRSFGMASNCSRRLIAVCQMTSSSNKERNLAVVAQLVKEASSVGAKVLNIRLITIIIITV